MTTVTDDILLRALSFLLGEPLALYTLPRVCRRWRTNTSIHVQQCLARLSVAKAAVQNDLRGLKMYFHHKQILGGKALSILINQRNREDGYEPLRQNLSALDGDTTGIYRGGVGSGFVFSIPPRAQKILWQLEYVWSREGRPGYHHRHMAGFMRLWRMSAASILYLHNHLTPEILREETQRNVYSGEDRNYERFVSGLLNERGEDVTNQVWEVAEKVARADQNLHEYQRLQELAHHILEAKFQQELKEIDTMVFEQNQAENEHNVRVMNCMLEVRCAQPPSLP